jgi:wobble nucleotide-excising tRNase
MGVSTYIWAETVAKDHIDQVILLTHNFELFRQWDVQIEGLHGMAQYPARLFEIRSQHVRVGDRTRRRPLIAAWPPSERARRMVRSSYHHAFMAVADARKRLAIDDSLENRLDAQLLFPNVIRRMLETFLAFKRPEWVGDFTTAMRKSVQLLEEAGYDGDASALRLRLTRYAHAYSHGETPVTDTTVSPDEVATAIASVFEFMHQIDRAHFRGLCEVVGLDPVELLPAVMAGTSEADHGA